MSDIDEKKLLRNKRVIEEINRHKWLESEISGFDRGWGWAAENWLQNYASAWVDYHIPGSSFSPSKKKTSSQKSASKTNTPKKK